MAARAGFVIAKGALAEFCRTRGLAHAPFRDFDDATRHLAEWLDRERDRRAPAPRGSNPQRRGAARGQHPG
jgi:hypothetical protein